MEKDKIYIVVLVIMWLVLTIFLTSWYVNIHQYDKCNAMSGNDYYYTEEGCWTILERPTTAYIVYFIVFGLLLGIPFGLPIVMREV